MPWKQQSGLSDELYSGAHVHHGLQSQTSFSGPLLSFKCGREEDRWL